ncbi:MAG TPA: phosphotransferase [Streptosporangiaceae bacterium]|jgi:homoserine kinase type II
MIGDGDLALYLRRYWGLDGARITELGGGMGSRTWVVERDAGRWVAKAVAEIGSAQFAGGLQLALHLEQAGLRAGAPVPASTGGLTVAGPGESLALLTWVPGEPLTAGSEADQLVLGRTLGEVHAALAGLRPESAQRFHWVDPAVGYLDLRPWLRPAIAAAVAALEEADPGEMTHGMLHADPSPDAFLFDPRSGRCGVIDWSYSIRGPLLYDVASAVMYLGGPAPAAPFIGEYLKAGLLGGAELDGGLLPMLRFRWAVQANYFAWRISTGDMTGISGPAENETGLEDARRALLSIG